VIPFNSDLDHVPLRKAKSLWDADKGSPTTKMNEPNQGSQALRMDGKLEWSGYMVVAYVHNEIPGKTRQSFHTPDVYKDFAALPLG
jgi:hypothetical protein